MNAPVSRLLRLASLLGLLPVLAACGGSSVTLSGPRLPSLPANCDFRVLTAIPGAGYEEIGTVDVQPGGYGVNTYRDLDGFKEKIRPFVCNAGGDAALAQANGYGMYMKATILKSTGQVAPAAGATAGGCQFDTQCKGDRVCVKGECTDPVKRGP